MNPYISVFEIFEDNKVLKERMNQLENEINMLKETNAKQLKEIKQLNESNSALKETIDARNEDNAPEILEYFHSCSSIRRTAWAHGMEMAELYELILQWEDSREGLQSADDYKECRIEIIGRREYDEEEEEDMTWAERKFRERALDDEDINAIISDYKDSTNLTLYELADRYELKINYLFKLLKENKVIDKETDAKGYAGFYQEHMGSSCEWDGKTELGLIES
jgi:regulator of replication initiation timing